MLRTGSGWQYRTPRSNGAVATRPGTALSSSALVVTFFVTCHLGEDSHQPFFFFWLGPSLNDRSVTVFRSRLGRAGGRTRENAANAFRVALGAAARGNACCSFSQRRFSASFAILSSLDCRSRSARVRHRQADGLDRAGSPCCNPPTPWRFP